MFTAKKKTLGTQLKRKAVTNSFLKGARKKSARTLSGNMAEKFSSTGDSFVDQFGKVGEYKSPRSFADISVDCATLFAEDAKMFVKFTIYLRMISRKTDIVPLGIKTETAQSGAELKHESIMRMIWLSVNHPDTFWKNIGLFISAGSFKDIITMLTYDLVHHGWDERVLDWNKMSNLISSLLENQKTVNLMKKYLPQIRAKSQLSTVEAEAKTMIGKWICSFVCDSNYKTYRKMKSSGTAHQWQQLISRREFDRLEFDKIHGRALNLLAKSKFLKNQNLQDRYSEWIDKAETVKYTGYPHEVLCELSKNCERNFVKTVDKQFMELVNKVKEDENFTKLIVVRDTSGSMGALAKGTKFSSDSIARAIAMYFSEFLDGDFKNHWIEFANGAEMREWKGSTPSEKWYADRSAAYGSTNFQSVIDLFVSLKRNDVPEEDFPEGIICISDGEFNPAQLGQTNVNRAKEKLSQVFSNEYVDNFKIVLWNIPNSFYGARSGTKFETFGDVKNVFYMSGYSASNIKFIMEGKVETAKDLFLAAMDQELLRLVEV